MPTDSVALARSWIMSRELFSDTFAKLTIRQLHPQGLAITLSGLVAMTDYASVGVLHNSSQRDSPSLKRVLPMIKHTHTAGPRRQRTLAKGGANSGLKSRLFSTRIWTAKLVETVGDLTIDPDTPSVACEPVRIYPRATPRARSPYEVRWIYLCRPTHYSHTRVRSPVGMTELLSKKSDKREGRNAYSPDLKLLAQVGFAVLVGETWRLVRTVATKHTVRLGGRGSSRTRKAMQIGALSTPLGSMINPR
ncbi:hypothetical protein C8Q72DRAFT_791671 [Fomitopsis betulina]|nr:hypothetical protein C8Q72DRAFT_791671 [Fomitopsis betulina]